MSFRPASFPGLVSRTSLRVALAALLGLTGASLQAQVQRVPAYTGAVPFGTVPVYSVGPSQVVSVALTAAQSVTSITAGVSEGNKQEFLAGAPLDCTADGSTVNPVNTVCNIPITFNPAYAGIRAVPLKIVTNTGTWYVGLSGVGTGTEPSFNAASIIQTIAGNPSTSVTSYNVAATTVAVNPAAIAVDGAGNIFLADTSAIERVDARTGILTSVAGGGSTPAAAGVLGTDATLSHVRTLAVDAAGNLYFSQATQCTVMKLDASTGLLQVVAGNGTCGDPLYGQPTTSSPLLEPESIAVDASGTLYIGGAAMLAKVDPSTAMISTLIATGIGNDGDGGSALLAHVVNVAGLAVDSAGNIFLSDSSGSRVREITKVDGYIHTVLGDGTAASTGDGALASAGETFLPIGLAVDGAGNLYVAEQGSARVRRVDGTTGIVTTVAGTGAVGTSGDGGPAVLAELSAPRGVAIDGEGNLIINDDTLVRQVTPQGSKPDPYLSTGAIDFGSQDVSTTSNYWTVTFNNTSGQTLVIGSIAVADTTNFSQTNNCPLVLPAYTNCNIQVRFNPQSAGTFNSSLIFIDEALHSPQSISLTGVGTSNAPAVVLSPSDINFADVPVGSTGNPWTVNLSNTTGYPLSIASLVLSNTTDFVLSNVQCGATLAAYSSCTLQVSLKPGAVGPHTGTLTFTDNASTGNGTQTIALSGNGTNPGPTVYLSPTTIDFGDQATHSTSNAWTVTVNNTSGTALTLSSMVLSDSVNFTRTTDCTGTLAAHSTCRIQVFFNPTTTGTLSGTLVLTDDDINSTTQIISLTGNGTTSTPVLVVSPSSVTFGSVTVGTTANPWTVNVSNTSGTTATFSTFALTGDPDFTLTNTCGTTLAAYSSCTVQIGYHPTVSGNESATLTVNAGGTAQTVAITGSGGTASTGSLQFSPSSVDFGNQLVYTTSTTRTVSLTNPGSSAVTILGILSVPDFPSTNNCGSSLAAGATCTIQVAFSPRAAGAETYNVQVFLVSSTLTLPVSGVGTLPASPFFSPNPINFGSQTLGTSNTWTATLNNPSDADLQITSLSGTGWGFTETHTCGSLLPAHSSCTLQITFAPSVVPGSYSGIIYAGVQNVTGSNVYNTQLLTLPLSGTGIAVTQNVFFAPTAVNFSPTNVGSAASAWTVTLNNAGGGVVSLSAIGLSDTLNFTQTNNCSSTLPASANCTIQVSFNPTASGTINGTLNVVVNGTPMSLPLNGTGTVAADYTLSVNPNTLTLNAGETGHATFTFTPVGGYQGTVYFSCTGLPVGATCTFAPPSVTANGTDTVQTSSLTVTTTSAGTIQVGALRTDGPILAGLALPGLALGLLWMRRRRVMSRKLTGLLSLALVGALMGTVTGCSSFSTFTPAGTTLVTVVASAGATGGSSSGSGTSTQTTAHTANFTLIVKN